MAHTHPSGDPACSMAHGELPPNSEPRTLVTVFVSPVSDYLLHFGRDLGFKTVLLEPDSERLAWTEWRNADEVATIARDDFVDRHTDVVITDHDRPELGKTLDSLLRLPCRWIGVMGSKRHVAPHIDALRALRVPEYAIARVHRPIGLNIGSRTPAEIAIATLAGLIADRNRRPGGYAF
ncbi:MAG TPA: xanthine dehydrogenase [Micromonosporaceae bacterium]|nr:xanthine dehydrogenase [Micromonosporaceae bacterium]